MNIFEAIRHETADVTDNIAVIEGNDRLTYGQLLATADRIAGTLAKSGVEPFSRVGILCEDSIDAIAASLAVLSLSAVVVPVPTAQADVEINLTLDRIDVHYLLFEEGTYGDRHAVPLGAGIFHRRKFLLLQRTVPAGPPQGYERMNPAFIRFSSGTTGTSKGVVLSHESILERTDAADRGLRITAEDTVLWVLSMSFHFVVTILLFLRRGATIVLCGQHFPGSLIEGLTRFAGTFIYASPFHYSVLAHSAALPSDAFKNVRMAVSTAMKLPDTIAEAFSEKFGHELNEAYGIIEVGLPFIRLSVGGEKRGSVGTLLPDYKLRIDNQDAEGIGEIYLSGKGMLDAYYSPWQDRESVLHDGWFKTGDLGKIDDDGFLTIVGRDRDVINFAGMKVFVQEVESVVNQYPHISESLVYGTAHPFLGQLPVAKIVLDDPSVTNLDLNELKKFCYQRLAQYKVPKDFEFVDALPKTASGKIKR